MGIRIDPCKYLISIIQNNENYNPVTGGLIMQAQEMQQMNSEKDWIVTLVLSILVGGLGIDRFYSGSILLGVLKLFTLGGLGLWWLIDLIMLVTGNYKDGDGNPIASK